MADRFQNGVFVPRSEDIKQIQSFSQLGGEAAELFNLSRERGNGLTDNNQILLDRSTLSPMDFQQKYGSEVVNQVNQLDAGLPSLRSNLDTSRSSAERTTDNLSDVVTGFGNAIGGIGVLGAGLVNPELGIKASQGLDAFNDFMSTDDSLAQKRSKFYGAERAQLDKQDNISQYTEDLQTDGKFVAGIKSIGRDVLNAGNRLLEDPIALESGVSQGIGSVLAAGPASKVIRSVPLVIGAMEGGGAYSQAVNEVMNTSFESLAQNSAEYRDLVKNGMSPQDAQKRIASAAGISAAAVQGPVGALTGKLVSKFEGNPLGGRGFMEALKDIGRETLEEGTQSATGALAQNAAIQTFADNNRNLTDDVGAQALEGAVFGGLSAGAINIPTNIVSSAAQGVVASAKDIMVRGKEIASNFNKQSSTSPEQMAETVANTDQAAPIVADNLSALAQEQNIPEEQKPVVEDYINRVRQGNSLTEQDINNIPNDIMPMMEVLLPQDKAPNRFDIITAMSTVAAKEQFPEAIRTAAGLYLLDQEQNNKKFFSEDIPQFFQNVPGDRSEVQEFKDYATNIQSMFSMPAVQQAMEWARNAKTKEADIELLNDSNLGSTESQRLVQNVSGIAQYAPENVDPKLAQQLFQRVNEGKIELDPKKLAMIKAAVSLQEAGNVYAQNLDEEIDPVEAVSRQIETEGGSKAYQYSMKGHVLNINEAIARGDDRLAKRRMIELNRFAQSQYNKAMALIDAINDPAEGRKTREFKVLGANHRWNKNPGQIGYLAGNAKSEAFARKVYSEAAALTDLVKNINLIYPQFAQPEYTLPAFPTKAPKQAFEKTPEKPVEKPVEAPKAEPVVESTPVEDERSKTSKIVDNEEYDLSSFEAFSKQLQENDNTKFLEDEEIIENPPAPFEEEQEDKVTEEDTKILSDTINELNTNLKSKAFKVSDEVRILPEGYKLNHPHHKDKVVRIAGMIETVNGKTVVSLNRKVFVALRDKNENYQDAKNMIMHELLHSIADRSGFIKNNTEFFDTFKKEYKDSSDKVKNWFKRYAFQYKDPTSAKDETFAEFGPALMTIGEDLRKSMPETVKLFEAFMENFENEDGQFELPLEPNKEFTPVPSEPEITEDTKPLEIPSESDNGMDSLFPDLLQTQKGEVRKPNYFKKAFSLSKNETSRLFRMEQPIEEVSEMLTSPKDLDAFIEKDIGYVNTMDQLDYLKEYVSLGSKIFDNLEKRLNSVLNTKKFNKKLNRDVSLLDNLDQGIEVNRYVIGRALNIAERNGNKFTYNRQLMDASVLAGLDWVINSGQNNNVLNKEDIAELLDINVNEVTDSDIDNFNTGIDLTSAKRGLGDQIVKFWGLKPNAAAYESQTKGIPEGVAAEVLKGLEAQGLIEFDYFNRYGKTYGRVILTDNANSFGRNIGGAKQLISDLMLVDKEVTFAVGTPPKDIAKTQLRNKLVNNTKEQLRVIETEQNTPYVPHTDMFDLIEGMGEENYRLMMGGQNYDENLTNKKHASSMKGKNRTIISSYNNVMQLMDDVRSHAKKTGKQIADIPVYWAVNFTRVNRMQMLGLATPTSDKLSREIFVRTKSILDMTDPVGSDAQKFWMTVGQGLGLKTEKEYRVDIMNQAKALAEGKYAEVISDLREWLRSKNSEQAGAISSKIRTINPSISMHGVHSLLAVAQLKNSNNLKEFTFYNSLEADGKTNGPINALALFSSGEFTTEWLETVAKGGFFVGRQNKSLNQHIKNVDKEDLYQRATTVTGQYQKDFEIKISGEDKNIQNHYGAFKRMLAALDVNINLNGDNLVLERGVAKNPLTISIYGSGVDGIAAKFANALLDTLYEKMSDYLVDPSRSISEIIYGDNAAKFEDDLDALLARRISVDKESGKYYLRDNKTQTKKPFSQYEVNAEEFETVKTNVRIMFVNQLSAAIAKVVLGQVDPVTSAIQKATHVQSIFLATLFQNKVIEKLVEKELTKDQTGWKSDDFLNTNELNSIYKELMPYSPTIDTGSQRFYLSAGQKTDLFDSTQYVDGKKVRVQINGTGPNGEQVKVTVPEAFARSLDDDLSTSAYVTGPTLAGVKAIPSLTIGSGDGLMQLIASQFGVRGLNVYDGLNMPADKIDQWGELVNKAVYETWNRNPAKAVADSFNQFMSADPMKALAQNNVREAFFIKEMAKALSDNPNETKISNEDIIINLSMLQERLNNRAKEIDARQYALKKVNISIDQMASAEAPFTYQAEGYDLADDASYSEIQNKLNQYYWEFMDRKEENQSPVETLEKIARVENNTGVFVSDTQNLDSLNQILPPKIAKQHGEMLKNTLKVLKDSGYKVVSGNVQQILDYRLQNQPDRIDSDRPEFYGLTDPVTKTVFVSNGSTETLVHELIHASTIEKLIAYYNDSKNLLPQDREAISRLEGLMNEWIIQDFSNQNAQTQTARASAINEVNSHLNRNQKPQALNEFMAWVLANEDLSRVAQETKVINPLFKIIQEAWMAIKKLVWGNKFSPLVNDSMYSNLRFNTRVLLATKLSSELLVQDMNKYALYQSGSYGSDDRITALNNKVLNKLAEFITTNTLDPQANTQKTKIVQGDAVDLADSFNAHGYSMSMQERNAFINIVSALMLETELNPNSYSRIQELYVEVIKNLSSNTSDLQNNPASQDQAEVFLAQDRYDLLQGNYLTVDDSKNRSSLVPAFLALAMTNNQFRSSLRQMKIDKSSLKNLVGEDLDSSLNNLGSELMDRLNLSASGEGQKAQNVQQALDKLFSNLLDNVGDQRSFIEQKPDSWIDGIDNYIKELNDQVGEKLVNVGKNIADNTTSRGKKLIGRGIEVAGAVLNTERSADLVTAATSGMNNLNLTTVREFLNEITGRTKENAPIFDMLSRVRNAVSQTRQQFREQLPQIISSKFSKVLSSQEQTDLFFSMGRSDLATLYNSYGLQRALELANDYGQRTKQIAALEASIASRSPIDAARILKKSKQLADYMIHGTYGNNLLRNAHAIASLLGEKAFKPVNADDPIVGDIDNLVSLYAFEALDLDTKKSFSDLLGSEREGIEYALSALNGQRTDELAKIKNNPTVELNYYKGRIPSENTAGASLVVARKSETAKFLKLGYKQVGNYLGSTADLNSYPMAYFYSPVSGRATYNQGVMQTVHQTVSGIDPRTGYTTNDLTAGRITDPKVIATVKKYIKQERPTTEPLLPVYDGNGRIVAYERAVDPNMKAKLNPNTNLAQMIGAWRGRQKEEELASEFNKTLVNNLYDIYVNDKRNNRKSEYVNLATTNDPVLQDAWNIIPRDTKDQIKDVFGDKQFWIRKDMLNDAVGFRSASVGDIFTGNTRLNKNVTNKLEEAALGLFGENAFKYLVTGEKYLQNFVSDAKVLIVVKSVIVPAGNMVSNVYQLINRGVPPRMILKGLRDKTVEVNDYIKRRDRQIVLESDLLAAKGAGNLVSIRKIETELKVIQDAYRTMSIYPLIEAGEYSAISDGGVTQEDLALSNGRWTNFVEKIANKIPEGGLKTTYRYAMITRDTALFQGLTRAVQYGDFIGKAILFDDLTKRKGMSTEEAVAQVNEAFVNYNRQAGRVRNALEANGLIWFWNFKLRIMKEAVYLMRNHPLRTLMMTAAIPDVPVVGAPGSPVLDNFAAVAWDGKLDSSLGIGQALRAPHLNPWLQVINSW